MSALQNPPPEPQFQNDDLAKLVVARLADEGVPIAAIARATHLPRKTVTDFIDGALRSGQIIELPPNDWPVKQKRTERTGHASTTFERGQIILDLMRSYKLTRQEAVIFHTLLKHKHASKEMLYAAAQSIHAVGNNTEPKIVDVVICKLRAKLVGKVDIKTIWGGGYFIEVRQRRKVWASIGYEISIDDASGDVVDHE